MRSSLTLSYASLFRSNPPLSGCVTAARNVADATGGKYEVLVAHQLGDRGGDFRRKRPLQAAQLFFGPVVAHQPFAKLADSLAAPSSKGGRIHRVQNQTANVVLVGVDQRVIHYFAQLDVCQS